MDLGDLLPKAEDLQRLKKENFEVSLTSRLVKDLGGSPQFLREVKKAERYDLDMLYADYPSFPWKMQIDRVERYSVEELFQKPTKSPVFHKFVEHFPQWASEEVLLFFKAKGFTVLVMGTLRRLTQCEVVLTTTVRGTPFYVTTYEEFADAVRELRLLEA